MEHGRMQPRFTRYEKNPVTSAQDLPCGWVLEGNDLLLYYGASDISICLAREMLDHLLDGLENNTGPDRALRTPGQGGSPMRFQLTGNGAPSSTRESREGASGTVTRRGPGIREAFGEPAGPEKSRWGMYGTKRWLKPPAPWERSLPAAKRSAPSSGG
jgi:hypothetical protein